MAALARGWPVTADDRAGMLRKYRLLAAWREIRDARGGGQGDRDGDARVPSRATLAALSREFPGALRELDVLGLREISRRIDRLAAPSGGGAPGGDDDVWLAWIVAYHGAMRAALVAKRVAGRTRRISGPMLAQLLQDTRAAAGVPIDEAFVRAAAHPPGGRLTALVLDTLAHRFAVPADSIAAKLFPPRRRADG